MYFVFFPREACHRDIVNLQVEMIKQFHMQLVRMTDFVLNECRAMDLHNH